MAKVIALILICDQPWLRINEPLVYQTYPWPSQSVVFSQAPLVFVRLSLWFDQDIQLLPLACPNKLPKTWPGLPILLDSPGWDPTFNKDTVEVKVAFDPSKKIANIKYDGVTAGLRVNQSVHAPLLCVVNVMDIASGDLSLPGKVNQ